MASKPMQIKEETKLMLDSIKLCPTETYTHVINRLINIYNQYNNKEE